MPLRHPRLLSPPFLTLYVGAVGTVALDLGRHRWSSAWWFPLAVGLVAGVSIIGATSLLLEGLAARPGRQWGRVAFFAFTAVLTTAGGVFLGSTGDWLATPMLLIAAANAMASVGTALQWRGFRSPDPPDAEQDGPEECDDCVHEYVEDSGGICPLCGATVQGWHGDEAGVDASGTERKR